MPNNPLKKRHSTLHKFCFLSPAHGSASLALRPCAGIFTLKNRNHKDENQKYMLTRDMSDTYDKDALVTSLDKIRNNSDNPLWFDGSRAMKVITNLISHKVDAKYIIPTKINMEEGLKITLIK